MSIRMTRNVSVAYRGSGGGGQGRREGPPVRRRRHAGGWYGRDGGGRRVRHGATAGGDGGDAGRCGEQGGPRRRVAATSAQARSPVSGPHSCGAAQAATGRANARW